MASVISNGTHAVMACMRYISFNLQPKMLGHELKTAEQTGIFASAEGGSII